MYFRKVFKLWLMAVKDIKLNLQEALYSITQTNLAKKSKKKLASSSRWGVGLYFMYSSGVRFQYHVYSANLDEGEGGWERQYSTV